MINSEIPFDKTAPWYGYHRLMSQASKWEGAYLGWEKDPVLGFCWATVLPIDPSPGNGHPTRDQQHPWIDEAAPVDERALKDAQPISNGAGSFYWDWRSHFAENPRTTLKEESAGSWELDDPADWYGVGDEEFH